MSFSCSPTGRVRTIYIDEARTVDLTFASASAPTAEILPLGATNTVCGRPDS